MKSTVINTSKEMTAYSDFPPPPDFANFMHNRRMLEYLELYANAFHLREHIRFNHRVINVQRHPLEYPSKGRWVVSYEANEDGKCIDELFDGVLLCTGHHTKPYVPAKPWPGMVDLYKGVVSHAHSYKDHQGYDDKVSHNTPPYPPPLSTKCPSGAIPCMGTVRRIGQCCVPIFPRSCRPPPHPVV